MHADAYRQSCYIDIRGKFDILYNSEHHFIIMVGFPEKITTRAQAELFVNEIDTFLLDCDGVIWHAENVLPGVIETLLMLKGLGKKILFVTNNSVKSRAAYAKLFVRLGFTFVTKEDIFCASHAAAVYLKQQQMSPSRGVMILGENGLLEELSNSGITTFLPPVREINRAYIHTYMILTSISMAIRKTVWSS